MSHRICHRRQPRIVRAILRLQRRLHPVFAGIIGDDIDCSRHGVRAIEHRTGSAQHLDALDILFVVEVSDVVGVYAGKLRMTVDHHQHGTRPVAAHATQLDMPRAAVAHAEAEDAALRHKQARHHPRYSRQDLCLPRSLKLTAVDY